MSVGLEGATSGTLQPSADPPKLDTLPPELLQQIFAMVSKNDVQSVALVSWSINKSVIDAANLNEPTALKSFIQRIIQGLNAEIFVGQREMLGEIARQITSQSFENLRELKKYILNVKTQLINTIKTVDEERANSLKSSVTPPHFLEDIFELSRFERQIDEANLISDEIERGEAFWDISMALMEAGRVDRAVAVATAIPRENQESWALRAICDALTEAGDIGKARTVAELIPNKVMRASALEDISDVS